MKLSVIIVNFNHKYFPKLAIEALEKSKTAFEFEIIVVDNASTDRESLGFLEKASKENRITFLKLPKNIGFGKGNNEGAKIARGEYLFFHNPDVIVSEDALQNMVDFMGKNKDIGLMGPKLIYSSGETQPSCRRHMSFFDLILNRSLLGKLPVFRERLNKYLMSDYEHKETQNVDLIVGAAMILPKHVFDLVNGFDSRYFIFMEDFDLCHMVRKAGYRVVYYPEVVLNHYHKRLSQGSIFALLSKKVFWHHLSSAAKFFWKWRKITKK
jgi:GT2 family glycosyltransferase